MEGHLPPKHKLDQDFALEPVAKIQKLADEDDEHPYALSRLPPEILLDIFDYLKPKDNCMKKLSQVCKKFYNLCSPRLRVLQIDLNKINARYCQPVIRREYTEIRIILAENDCSKKEREKRGRIGNFLQSSRKTARKLVIRDIQKECYMKMRKLMSILRSLPHLVKVEINQVHCLLPLSSEERRKEIKDKKPTLSNLKKLIMKNVTAKFCWAFDGAENIEELKLEITAFKDRNEWIAYQSLVTKQTKLRLLNLDLKISNKVKNTENAVDRSVFLEAALGGNDIESLLTRFPMLEHIKLRPFVTTITQALLIAGPPVSNVKTIELLGKSTEHFDIDQIRQKFPSLESFKSFNLNWSITSV